MSPSTRRGSQVYAMTVAFGWYTAQMTAPMSSSSESPSTCSRQSRCWTTTGTAECCSVSTVTNRSTLSKPTWYEPPRSADCTIARLAMESSFRIYSRPRRRGSLLSEPDRQEHCRHREPGDRDEGCRRHDVLLDRTAARRNPLGDVMANWKWARLWT